MYILAERILRILIIFANLYRPIYNLYIIDIKSVVISFYVSYKKSLFYINTDSNY